MLQGHANAHTKITGPLITCAKKMPGTFVLYIYMYLILHDLVIEMFMQHS